MVSVSQLTRYGLSMPSCQNLQFLYALSAEFAFFHLQSMKFIFFHIWSMKFTFFSVPVDEIHIFTCLIDELLHLFDLIIFLFYRFSKFSIFICKISNSENFESIGIDGLCQPIDEISEFFMNNWWNSWFFSMSNWRVLLFVS